MAGRGCNAILKSGGRLTETAVDIYNFFGINLRETVSAPKLSLSADEELLFTVLKELGETHISMLSQKSGLPPFKARTLLSSLEVKGLVVGVGGNRYSPV